MGGNMVRRLMKAGHTCVVYDRDPENTAKLVAEGAIGAATLDEFVAKLTPPRAAWVMVPAGAAPRRRSRRSPSSMQPGDIIIDGGNSFYKDDVRRAEALQAPRDSLRRRRHERRRLGHRARLLPDGRRRRRGRSSTSIRSSKTLAPGAATSRARPGARARPAPPRRATSTAVRPAPGTSSR